MKTISELEPLRWKLRRDCVDIIMSGGGGHIGGDMSVLDTLLVLYGRHLRTSPSSANDPERDRFILSKGHAMEAYYAVLCEFGFLDLDEVKQCFSQFNSPYLGHPSAHLNGIDVTSGSLGHGLSVGVGMALAARMDSSPRRAYVIMGDGELAEGSIWEAAMAAGTYKLSQLCAIIDRNRLQISGNTEDVMCQDPLEERWCSFGWQVISIDGHSLVALNEAFTAAAHTTDKPTLIVANTIKGCGSSLMENKAGWHHHLPNDEEYAAIMRDLTNRQEACRG